CKKPPKHERDDAPRPAAARSDADAPPAAPAREAPAAAPAPQPEAYNVHFRSGRFNLAGRIWKPAGPGPFPTMVWNHGSGQHNVNKETLADFFTKNGYVFFQPHRRGHGDSEGAYYKDQPQRQAGRQGGGRGGGARGGGARGGGRGGHGHG